MHGQENVKICDAKQAKQNFFLLNQHDGDDTPQDYQSQTKKIGVKQVHLNRDEAHDDL